MKYEGVLDTCKKYVIAYNIDCVPFNLQNKGMLQDKSYTYYVYALYMP